MDIYELREKYLGEAFDAELVSKDPFILFQKWFEQAKEVKIHEPHAFALATVGKSNMPSVRMLLIKDFNASGFSFFSNYESRKAQELENNPNASMVFFWSELERQVRISGTVQKLPESDSDAYFKSRPAGSRLGAWASPQSREILDRNWLIERQNEFSKKFRHGDIPRPTHWGGYLLKPSTIEFWQGRTNRLHDRLEYFLDNNTWKIRRLAP